MKTDRPIEIGIADKLLSEGRLRAERDQMPFMTALKAVIREKLEALESEKPLGSDGGN